MAGLEVSIADEVATIRMERPHVVVLGAGASLAACPDGDRNGKRLPLMADFAERLELSPLLESWGLDPAENFEETYSTLHEAGDHSKLDALNERVDAYFSLLELPDHPTVYDHLVLSLRGQDVIATFNWDPFLIQAYRRTPQTLSKPRLAFLHGSVLSGYCEADHVYGVAGARCSQCRELFKRTPLLFPVRNKNYAADASIAAQWNLFKDQLGEAFMITIFGYSGPRTDAEAIDAMKGAWGPVHDRAMEQTEFITRQLESEITASWKQFIHTHHYEVHDDFYASWIANHPRRTGEAYLSQYIDAKFISDNPIPRNLGFEELEVWFDQFRCPEEEAEAAAS